MPNAIAGRSKRGPNPARYSADELQSDMVIRDQSFVPSQVALSKL